MDPETDRRRDPPAEARLPSGLSPDWVFDRDLACPQCRYNLRMLRNPRCPECGTLFRWQALLKVDCPRCGEPLGRVEEGACPRCGLALDWKLMLSKAPPAARHLYEYSDRPARAVVRTCFALLLPGRFWRGIPLELPPATGRLRNLHRTATIVGLVGLLAAGMDGRFGAWIATCAIALGLPLVTRWALPCFGPTLTRFNVRRDQLLRCAAYGSVGLGWIGVLYCFARLTARVGNTIWPVPRWWGSRVFEIDLLSAFRALFGHGTLRSSSRFNLVLGALFFGLALFWWWRCVYVSLRCYLRLGKMDALAVFVSTQLIALLLVMLVITLGLHLTYDGRYFLSDF